MTTNDTRTWEERMADAYIASGLPIVICPTCEGLSDQDGECSECENRKPSPMVKVISLIGLAMTI